MVGIIRTTNNEQIALNKYDLFPNMKYYNGWNNRSGPNRVNSIIIPAVNVIQTAAKTGAVDKNLTKCVMKYLQNLEWI